MGAPSALKSTTSSKPLVFALNGQRVELSSVDPATTLLSYIRSETRFKGPKRGCGEGGCGVCVVMLAKYNPETKEVKESSVNSCLVMLCSVDGCAITTTEGLCKDRNDFHAIHKRISAFHGSQCGFCTPGMAMAIYGCLKHDQQQQAANGNETLTKPSSDKLERALQGNICRCTGYRPLLDVCKSFASDVDLEDLGLNTCWTHKADAKEENLPLYDPKADPQFPQFLIDELETQIHSNGSYADYTQVKERQSLDARFTHIERSKEGVSERAWVSASTLADLSAALEALRGRNQKVKLVVGNTSAGYYKDLRQVDVFVDISQIPELLAVRRDACGLELGAATRIAELIDYLEEWPHSPVAEALEDHLKKLAGGHVRNWGSVGGNLVMAQKFGFASDVATILLGAGASVKVVALKGSNANVTELSLEEFLAKGTKLGEKSILQSVYIPLVTDSETVFKTFRGAPRPYGNAVSLANAAFLVQVSRSGKSSTVTGSARLAFGAFGTRHAIRALRVEELLKGKSLTLSLVKEAVEVVKTEVVPLEGTTTKEYRVSLAVGFLFDFLNSLLSGESTVTPTHLFPHVGKQQFTVSDEHYPISQPTSKFLSQNQASGEAVYVDDIPSPPGCLHAAFVLSSEPYAEIKGVDTAAALRSVGAVAYVSASDIPGKNLGIINPFTQEMEPLFADGVVGFVGHPLGVLVADTYENARMAAGKVNVNYDTRSVGAPIMTVDDAVAKNSVFSIPPMFLQSPIGDVEKGLAAADFKSSATVSTKSQNHFYMETQTDLAIPDEDGCIIIYTASQAIDPVQQVVAACLNIPIHNVRVITRRLGGGFGGKVFRNQQIAAAIALAAYTLRRPVRVSLDRNTDMQLIGGRFLTKTNYTVGFTKTGKITALIADVLLEGGWFVDGNTPLSMTLSNNLKKYNYGSLNVNYTLCKTNNVPKTAMRAPGDCEGSAIADAILDHVASYLGLSGNKVRDENLHTLESIGHFHGVDAVGDANGFTLPVMWDRLKSRVKMEEREKEIEVFNEQSRWIKRGLAMVTCTFHALTIGNMATVSIFQDGSIVVEVGGVEMGQGLYTKVRQAVAYSLSPLWNKNKDVDMLAKIRVLQADSLSLPNSFADGGSTTSEGTCASAQKACAILVQRLQPVKEQLAKDQADGMVTWELLCLTARQMQIDLQSHERWSTPMVDYIVYGVGASEVEVNILTGETRILASDLIHDAGKSLNPAVDIGQVEGAFVMGVGYYLTEDVVRDAKGKLLSDGTWTYKPPTIDTIPQKFNVELYNSPAHKDRIFSSKAVGEPPLTLAGSVYSAVRNAIRAARKDYFGGDASSDIFELSQPATIDKVKSLCGLDNVERYLQATLKTSKPVLHGKLT